MHKPPLSEKMIAFFGQFFGRNGHKVLTKGDEFNPFVLCLIGKHIHFSLIHINAVSKDAVYYTVVRRGVCLSAENAVGKVGIFLLRSKKTANALRP